VGVAREFMAGLPAHWPMVALLAWALAVLLYTLWEEVRL